MIGVGIVGIGFMGMIHYLAYQKLTGVRVAAIVSRSRKKREGDWRGIKGNFGPEGTVMDLGDAARYDSLDQLLNDDRIDLVDVCLPPSLHAEASTKALAAGKNVLCEKPIAVQLADADRMIQAAKDSGKLLMIGHVLPFFPEYSYLRSIIEQNIYGKLKGGFFKRIISDPTWLENYYDPIITGGPLIDLHIHDAHFIRFLCGLPEKLFSSGRMRQDVVEFATTQFLFAGNQPPSITAISGVVNQQGRPFTQAFEIHLDAATVLFDSANLGGKMHLSMPVTILTQDGEIIRPEIRSMDPSESFVLELQEVINSIEDGSPSKLLDGVLARDALRLCHLQTESIHKGETVSVSS